MEEQQNNLDVSVLDKKGVVTEMYMTQIKRFPDGKKYIKSWFVGYRMEGKKTPTRAKKPLPKTEEVEEELI